MGISKDTEQLAIDILADDKGTFIKVVNAGTTLEEQLNRLRAAAMLFAKDYSASMEEVAAAMELVSKSNAITNERYASAGFTGENEPVLSSSVPIKTLQADLAEASKLQAGVIDMEIAQLKAINLLEAERISLISKREVIDQKELDRLNKNRVQLDDINMSQVEMEDIQFNKKQASFELDKQTNEVWKRRETQIRAIADLAPADQIKPMAKLINEEINGGLTNTNGLMRKITDSTKVLPTTMQKVAKEVENVRNGFVKMMKEAFSLSSVMNTLFGVGMAMIVFQLTQLVTNFVMTTIKNVELLQNSITSLSAAEKSMSKSGVEVTGGDLLDIALRLQKVWTNISKIDLMDATGSLALKLSDKGISPEQIEKILQFALSRRILYPEKSLAEIVTTTSSALLSNNYEGVNTLGAGLNQKSIDNKAKELGLINDINKSLTEQQTIAVKILLLDETTNANLSDILAKQNDLANASNQLAANWLDLTGNAGAFVDTWNGFLLVLNDVVLFMQKISDALTITVDKSEVVAANFNTIKNTLVLFGQVFMGIASIATIVGLVITGAITVPIAIATAAILALMAAVGIKLKTAPKPMTVEDLRKQDTPTEGIPVISDEAADKTEDNAKKMQKWINDVIEAMDAFIDKAKKMEEDYKIAMDKMAQDQKIARDRFMQDWGIDRAKVVDDANKAIAQKEKEYRDKQKEEEAKFQEDLRQLREKYLMSLEDALHERDARAVIRLAREYAMNKQNMINEHNLSRQSASTGHQNSIAQMAKERDDRLRQLDAERALEWARKEEDYKLKVTRAEEEHVLEMKRLEEEKQDKLRQLGQSFAEQFGLNSIGSKKIYDLLDSYFGQGKGVDKMMKWTYDNVVAYAAAMATQLTAIYDQYKATAAAIGTYNPGTSPVAPNTNLGAAATVNTYPSTYHNPIPFMPTAPPAGYQWVFSNGTWRLELIRGMAEGGLAVADKATNVTFGEKSKELALFLPLNRLSTLFGSASGGSNMQSNGGKMELMVTLSPDLETRIVNKSLDSMANTIMQVRKGR